MYLEDMITIKTKARKGSYVTWESETFSAIRLPVPALPGVSDKLHIHYQRLDKYERAIMPLKHIESIDGVNLLGSAKTEWVVQGSKGNKYTVKLSGSIYKCSCPAFMYRKGDCKHITQIKNEGVK